MFLAIPLIVPTLVAFIVLCSPKWPVTRQGAAKALGNLNGLSDYRLTQYLKEHRTRFLVFLAITMTLSGLSCAGLCWLGNRKVWDREVWHYKVVKIRHEEKWTEEERRTRQVACGTDSKGNTVYRTETYYVTETYGPYWTKYLENGDNERISQGEYARWRDLWANEQKVGEHKGSAAGFSKAITGGIFDCVWPKTFETVYPHAEIHSYKWKVRYSESALRDVARPTEELAKRYPRPAEQKNTSPVISYEGVSLGSDAELLLRRVNADLGPRKQIHTILVLFKGGTPRTVVDDVLAAWQLPNKNELVTFISLDGQDVKWVEVYSWIDDTTLHGNLETALAGEPFTAERYARLLMELVPKQWRRKHASEFDYLKVDLHWGWGLGAFLLSIAIVCGAYFGVDRWDLFQDGEIRPGNYRQASRFEDYTYRPRRGHRFTLIELMVVIAIVAIVISIVGGIIRKFM